MRKTITFLMILGILSLISCHQQEFDIFYAIQDIEVDTIQRGVSHDTVFIQARNAFSDLRTIQNKSVVTIEITPNLTTVTEVLDLQQVRIGAKYKIYQITNSDYNKYVFIEEYYYKLDDKWILIYRTLPVPIIFYSEISGTLKVKLDSYTTLRIKHSRTFRMK